eukprot:IDg9771t1
MTFLVHPTTSVSIELETHSLWPLILCTISRQPALISNILSSLPPTLHAKLIRSVTVYKCGTFQMDNHEEFKGERRGRRNMKHDTRNSAPSATASSAKDAG